MFYHDQIINTRDIVVSKKLIAISDTNTAKHTNEIDRYNFVKNLGGQLGIIFNE